MPAPGLVASVDGRAAGWLIAAYPIDTGRRPSTTNQLYVEWVPLFEKAGSHVTARRTPTGR